MPNELEGKSVHAIGQMIASRDATIKALQKELAEARVGGQPASQLRDAVLPVLEKVLFYLRPASYRAVDVDAADKLLSQLITHLKSIPSLEPPSEKMAEKNYGKPYKPLDHGKPER